VQKFRNIIIRQIMYFNRNLASELQKNLFIKKFVSRVISREIFWTKWTIEI